MNLTMNLPTNLPTDLLMPTHDLLTLHDSLPPYDNAATAPIDAQDNLWLCNNGKVAWALFKKDRFEILGIEVETWGECLVQLFSIAIRLVDDLNNSTQYHKNDYLRLYSTLFKMLNFRNTAVRCVHVAESHDAGH